MGSRPSSERGGYAAEPTLSLAAGESLIAGPEAKRASRKSKRSFGSSSLGQWVSRPSSERGGYAAEPTLSLAAGESLIAGPEAKRASRKSRRDDIARLPSERGA